MSEIWIWTLKQAGNEAADARPLPDITDYAVEATDGHIGKIDEASFDDEARGCIVVDTGFWIFGKQRMIPAGFISDVDWDEKKVLLTVSKDEVKGAPDYDDARKGDEAQRQEVGAYFDRSRYAGLHGDPVGPQAGPGRPD